MLGAACFFYTDRIFDNIACFAPGRIGTVATASAKVFLESGSPFSFRVFVEGIFGIFRQSDYPVYVGILSLALVVYACLRVRNGLFFLSIGVLAFLVLFAGGKRYFVAQVLYDFFPPIRYFRYVDRIGQLFRFWIVIMAGFGFDKLLSDLEGREADNKRFFGEIYFPLCGFLMTGAAFFCFWKGLNIGRMESAWNDFFTLSAVMSLCVLFIMGRFIRLTSRAKTVIFLACYTVVMVAFQDRVFAFWPNRLTGANPAVNHVSKMSFQSERIMDETPTLRAQEALKAVSALGVEQGVEAYNFLQIDPCFAAGSVMLESAGVKRLVEQILGIPLPVSGFIANAVSLEDPRTIPFFRIIGCYSPKIRLVPKVLFADTVDETKRLMGAQSNGDGNIVLRGVADPMKKSSRSFGNFHSGTLQVKDFSLNTLKLETDVKNPGGAWLYYADAYDPGWRAYVDGRQVAIEEANFAFKAVRVGEGRHSVQFRFLGGWGHIANVIIVIYCLIVSAAVMLSIILLVTTGNPWFGAGPRSVVI